MDTSAAPVKPPKLASLDSTLVTFAVSDPEVLQALSEYADGNARTHFLATALKVGVLALKAARGTLDGDTLRREGDRLMGELGTKLNDWRGKFEARITGSLEQYFDPTQGLFMDRVHRLTKPDGDLAIVMGQQVQAAQTGLEKVFQQFVGENSLLLRLLDPSGGNELVATLQRTLETAVQTQNHAILGQFSLDNKEGALVRFLGELTSKHGDLNSAFSRDMQAVMAEFSLDKEDSALSKLVLRVESAQRSLASELSLDNDDSALQRLHRMLQDHHLAVVKHQSELATRLDAAIQNMNTRRDEALKSTRHGHEFEATLSQHLQDVVRGTGDVLRETGLTVGLKPNCKIGDYVLTIGPEKQAAGAQIVIEAKENASYDLAKSLEEAHIARSNRQAEVCVFVHSVRTAPLSVPTFQRYGRDIIVKWDADDDGHDVWLQAALMVATALSVKSVSHDKKDAASFAKIDKAVERIRKAIEGFEEVNSCAQAAKNAAEKIQNRARLTQETLLASIQTIVEEGAKLKEASDSSDQRAEPAA